MHIYTIQGDETTYVDEYTGIDRGGGPKVPGSWQYDVYNLFIFHDSCNVEIGGENDKPEFVDNRDERILYLNMNLQRRRQKNSCR